MTNFEKLCESYPYVISSSIRAQWMCPAPLYGLTVCKESLKNIGKKNIEEIYSMKNRSCRECAEKFWESRYKGAEIEFPIMTERRKELYQILCRRMSGGCNYCAWLHHLFPVCICSPGCQS